MEEKMGRIRITNESFNVTDTQVNYKYSERSRILDLFLRNPGRVFHYYEIMSLCNCSKKTVLNFIWKVRKNKFSKNSRYGKLNIQPVFIGNARRQLGYYVHIPDGVKYGLGDVVNPIPKHCQRRLVKP